ncbi:MAG: hypothetical protein EHM12_00915 [Dehalococcoidia bacterium]|nr:MAG: hypothetical protein EHM12_00915 [Dehalococcoidia bacterium]
MSYICEVCGPRLDCHSILCSNCDMGIIYEIKIKESNQTRRSSAARASEDAHGPSILYQMHLFETEQGADLVSLPR